MKKKTTIFGLLTAACLFGGAAAFCACDRSDDTNSAFRAVYDSYVAAAESSGSPALSYDEWLESIRGKDGVSPTISIDANGFWVINGTTTDVRANGGNDGVASVTVNSDGDLVVTKFDGSTQIVVLPKSYFLSVVDEFGVPVKDVRAQIVGYSGNTEVSRSEIRTGTESGLIVFTLQPDASVQYRAEISSVPKGYALPTEVAFNAFRQATVVVALSNDIADNQIFVMPYARGSFATNGTTVDASGTEPVYSDERTVIEGNRLVYESDDPTTVAIDESTKLDSSASVTGQPYSLDATFRKSEQYYYFSFSPYVSPKTTDDYSEIDRRIAASRAAASGTYTLTFDVRSGNPKTVSLVQFNATEGFVQKDANGIPSSLIAETQNGESGLSVNIDSRLYSSRTYYFYLTADAPCEITVTVARTGDAIEYTQDERNVSPSRTPVEYSYQTENATIREMPLDGSLPLVQDEEGFYRLDLNANDAADDGEPVVFVNLKGVNSARIGEYSIFELQKQPIDPNGDVLRGASAYDVWTPDPSDEYHSTMYHYADVVNGYAAVCNSDGLYPLNEDLKTFLTAFGDKLYGANLCAKELRYLLACVYYEPESGLPLFGSGTQSDPYLAQNGKSTVGVDGSEPAYVRFTSARTGWYQITPENLSCSLVCVTENVASVVRNGVLYLETSVSQSYVFTLSGSESFYPLTIAPFAENAVLSGSDPLSLRGAAPAGSVYEVVLDTASNPQGVSIDWKAVGAGTYRFTVFGDQDGRVFYDGNAVASL
ncbi:MAG: hypothetical protein ACI4NG_00370, partial [Candidatus Gallimonas sp.]